MVTSVQFTVDTELSLKLFQDGADAQANFDSSIAGKCRDGEYGIFYQMDALEAAGLTGVFFVDPMPALVYGPDIVARIVQPIVARGHEVQLHIHTEWLEFASGQENPHENAHLRGRNIGDFALNDQVRLLGQARDLLIEAGAPAPTAFRAGNFGANDDTLRALNALGIGYDSSLNPAFLAGVSGGECAMALAPETPPFVQHHGVGIIPVSIINDRPGHIRAVQLCALSAWEMRAALAYAARDSWPVFTIVSHSFELLSRDRSRGNPIVIARFNAMCRNIARHPQLASGGFDLIAPHPVRALKPMPANLLRTVLRYGEQAVSKLRFEAAVVTFMSLSELALRGSGGFV